KSAGTAPLCRIARACPGMDGASIRAEAGPCEVPPHYRLRRMAHTSDEQLATSVASAVSHRGSVRNMGDSFGCQELAHITIMAHVGKRKVPDDLAAARWIALHWHGGGLRLAV